jgi:cell division protein FtsL
LQHIQAYSKVWRNVDKMRRGYKKFLLSIWFGIFIGFILGAVCCNALISLKIDKYYQEIKKLETAIEDRDARLRKLDESIKELMRNKKRYIVTAIEINLIYDGSELEKMEIEKHIKEKFNHLVGKEVKSIDIETVEQVIDKRIFKLTGKEFRLKVDKLVLDEVLRMWVEIEAG